MAPSTFTMFGSTLARFVVISVWAGLLVMLWQGPEARLSPSNGESVLPESSADGGSGERWMGLYMGDRKVGYSRFSSEPHAGGFTLRDRSLLRLRVLESDQTIHAETIAQTDDAFALRSFQVRLDSGAGAFEVDGAVIGGELAVTMRAGGHSEEHRFPLDGPVFVPSGLRASLVRAGLREGLVREAPVFDPAAMATEPLTIRAVALETVESRDGAIAAWRLEESFRGIETTVWVDDTGTTVREQGPMGLIAVRESAARATGAGWSDGALVDLMDAVAVPVARPIDRPRELARLDLSVSGLGPLSLPADDRQRVEGGAVAIRREELAAGDSYQLPYRGGEWESDLQPSSFVQSAHPRIRDTAERIIEGESDARAVAGRLRRWVFERLEKRPVASVPNALQVLEMAAGDCNEHAVLYAALARAVGLPARVVAGVTYADGVFLYHAWNEVWLGQRWISVDATFDQMPVDATHLKLLSGEPDRHIGLVPVIGELAITVNEHGDR